MTTPTMRHAPLAMDAATFRAIGHRLVDQLAESLASVALGPITRAEAPSAVREALDLTGPLPESGTEPGPLLEQTARLGSTFQTEAYQTSQAASACNHR